MLIETIKADLRAQVHTNYGTGGRRRHRARCLCRSRRAATFEVRDGTDNGLPDASFDRVWVMESSHLMPDREALFSECARVLRPGGRLVLCDLIRRREIPFLELRERREEFAVLRAAFGAARMDPLDVYSAYAAKAGLVPDQVTDLTTATLPTFDRWQDNVTTHRAEVTRILGEESVDVFERSLGILRRLLAGRHPGLRAVLRRPAGLRVSRMLKTILADMRSHVSVHYSGLFYWSASSARPCSPGRPRHGPLPDRVTLYKVPPLRPLSFVLRRSASSGEAPRSIPAPRSGPGCASCTAEGVDRARRDHRLATPGSGRASASRGDKGPAAPARGRASR